MKTCSKCKIEKSRSEFYRCVSKKDGLQSSCKICQNERDRKRQLCAESRKKKSEYGRKYRAANRERIYEYRKENRDRILARHREWYAANRKRLLDKQKAWREDNRETHSLNNRNYRARLRSAEGSHTVDDICILLELQRHKCAYCKICVKDGYHVDHIIALANGGTNWPSNLQILCQACNLSKHAKCPIEFAQENGRLL